MIALLALVPASLVAVPAAGAAPGGGSGPPAGRGPGAGSGVKYTTVGQAAPDECWQPPTDPSNPSDYGIYSDQVPQLVHGVYTCPSGYVPKVNQAYVWGLTQTQSATNGDNIWFGTVANTLCLVQGSFLGDTTPMVTSTYTCEFGSSPFAAAGVPAALGDWRPPELFKYEVGSKQPVNLESLNAPASDTAIQELLNVTVGIRSATSAQYDGHTYVIFAGPTMSTTGGITMFAFKEDGTFVGGTVLSAYNDIRRWVTDGSGGTYTGVGLSDNSGGAVLKWTPTSTDPSATGLFDFTEIAAIPGDVAELTVADSRLVAGTWPNFQSNMQSGVEPANVASVYESPQDVSIADLTTSDSWSIEWKATDYEPDFATALTYGVGAMASYGGYVYFGTMHVPGMAAEAEALYQTSLGVEVTSELAAADFVGTNRAFSLYRLDPSTGEVELLYGDAELPVWTEGAGWQLAPNNMGTPLYGASGFGNVFNNYEWSMAVYHGQLYVGTMDWSYLASQLWDAVAPEISVSAHGPNPLRMLTGTYGADLFMFPSTDSAAQALSTNGVGNYLNYGVRNMVATDTGTTDSGLYLGMANPMNLATARSTPPGGWNLIDLTTK